MRRKTGKCSAVLMQSFNMTHKQITDAASDVRQDKSHHAVACPRLAHQSAFGDDTRHVLSNGDLQPLRWQQACGRGIQWTCANSASGMGGTNKAPADDGRTKSGGTAGATGKFSMFASLLLSLLPLLQLLSLLSSLLLSLLSLLCRANNSVFFLAHASCTLTWTHSRFLALPH
jgi:hypothetical protein